MTRKSRVLCLMTACVLCIVLALSALAEGKLFKMWNAGCALLMNTENVTLSGHAVFTLDGEVFKTFNGSYRQEEYNSHMQVMLDTPQEDGSVYTGGYTVTVNDGVAYSVETAWPYQVGTTHVGWDKTILTSGGVMGLIQPLGLLAEGLPLDVAEEKLNEGVKYRITAKKEEIPAEANKLLTQLTKACAEEYLLIPSFADAGEEGQVNAFYQDYEALKAYQYKKIYGEELPENYYELLYDNKGNETNMYQRCQNIEQLMWIIFEETANQYAGGGLGVIMADGSVASYESYEDYLMDTGKEEVYYATELVTVFEKWYEKTTGEKPDGDAYNALYEEDGLFDKMNEDFAKQLRAEGYPCGIVYADGTITGYKKVADAEIQIVLNNATPTYRILSTLSEIKAQQADVTVTLDVQGRISAVEGEAAFVITDIFAKEHTLKVAFDGKAFDYGTTKVEAFDTDVYLASVE